MSAIPEVGSGFGATYTPPVATRSSEGRDETFIETIVGGKVVTVIVRSDIVPEDPFQNMARAAAYSIATNSIFPVPPLKRGIKDHLIRVSTVI